MFRSILIFFGSIFVLTAPLLATSDPAAGTVISVVGNPKISEDQGHSFHKVELGELVSVGAIIRTGSGKVGVLLNEGSTVRLAQNTELTFKEQDPDQDQGGSVFALAKGFARFLVNKIKPGNHFEVHTSNAVAAVKGTDFEAGMDGGKTQVWVFAHNSLGKLEFSDLKQLQTVLLTEGHYASFDGTNFDHGEFNPRDSNHSNDRYNGLSIPQEGGAGSNGVPKNASVGSPVGIGDSINDHMGDILGGIQKQIIEQHNTNSQIAAQTQSADFFLQRMVIDEAGVPDLVTHTYMRPNPETIENVTVNQRPANDTNGGTSSLVEITSFNAPLPYNWQAAFEAPVNLLLYRTTQESTMENPLGNTFSISTVYTKPMPQLILQYFGPPIFLQGVTQSYYIDHLLYGTLSATPANGNYSFSGDSIALNDTSNNNSGFDFFYEDSNSVQGAWSFQENLFALGNGNLSNNQATLYNVTTAGASMPSEFWTPNRTSTVGLAGQVSGQGIAGLPSAYNVEMQFTAAGIFSIDLVFLPGFFDTYDLGFFQNENLPGGG
jgi:hypothetical protein